MLRRIVGVRAPLLRPGAALPGAVRPACGGAVPVAGPGAPPRVGVRTIVLRSNWDESKSRTKRKSTLGSKIFFSLLVLMPIVSFGLGTWQVRRLRWKVNLISSAEERLLLPPLELPATVNETAANEFDYRRVQVTGEYDHSKEQLVGPRIRFNRRGYFVVTPLRRPNGSTLLVFRGWVDEAHRDPATRPESLVKGPVTEQCLLHTKPKKNMFTPESRPGSGEWYFMDIDGMAQLTGAQAVYIEALMKPDTDMPELLLMKGVPIGGEPKVTYRNSHFQYILTWYGLSLFTTIMLIATIRQRRAAAKDPMKRMIEHAKKWQ